MPESASAGAAAVLAALEAALVAAAAHGRTAGPEATPAQLLPLLRLDRLSAEALEIVRSAVDADDNFREAVAASTTAADVGDVGWAWLTRRSGWDELLIEVMMDARAAEAARRRHAAERSAERRLESVERELADIRRELDAARGRLERSSTTAAERQILLARAERRNAELAQQLDEVKGRLAAALQRANGAEAALGEQRQALRLADAEIARLGGRLAETEQQLEFALGVAGSNTGVGLGAPANRPAGAATPAVSSARRPVRVGRGLREGTPEATAELLAWPGAVVLVDGYNVAMEAWPTAELGHRRDRLVASLDRWCRAAAAAMTVVFDGAGGVASRTSGDDRTEGPVTVAFSADGVEADDDILARVAAVPDDVPVVVVSTDRRVREGAISHGANVVRSADLLGVLTGEGR